MTAASRDYWPTDGWRATAPEDVGVNPEHLDKAERMIGARLRNSVNALVIVKSGYLVFEKYYNGFNENRSHHVASVTKSVTSALVGIAIDNGFIESVEQKVLDFFPEFRPKGRDVLKRKITLQHLLTMTAGFKWHWGAYGAEPLGSRMVRSKDWARFVLNLPFREHELGRFQYNSGVSHLISAIISRAVGKPARQFANEVLFAPIGASKVSSGGVLTANVPIGETPSPQWVEDPQGNTLGGWGLSLRPRDMARFGFLYLNEGKWDGGRIVSKQWILNSVSARTHMGKASADYGYQWWLREVNGVFVFAACGIGGHHIFCVPEKDLVVIIASRQAARWQDRWPLLEKCILPATE
jgi:CubicO group peptidase (beta-lactamase class C family)